MPTVIFDFDSTLVSCESLDEIQLKQCQGRPELFKKICTLTKQGMSGEIPFSETLKQRLKLLPPKLSEVLAFAEHAHNFLSPGVLDVLKDLRQNGVDLWIISGGLIEVLQAVGTRLNIPLKHIHGASIIWGAHGIFKGLDPENAFNFSKYREAKTYAPLWSTPSIMIGDGMTDYTVFAKGLTDHFVAYTQYASRQAVLSKDCPKAEDMNHLYLIIKEIIANASL